MVAVLPAENMARSKEIGKEAGEFGREHFDGTGWTDIYVIPGEEHPISEWGIALEELRELVGGRLKEAEKVFSGYSSQRDKIEGGFAFRNGYPDGAFYGSQADGVIMSLNVILPDGGNEEAVRLFVDVLGPLGRKYSLMLANWWANEAVDLRDGDGLQKYFISSDNEVV
jgi:hypothetical protein